MKYLKTYEEINLDELREMEIREEEHKIKLCNVLVDRLKELMLFAYPNVEVKIHEEKGLYLFDMNYKFRVENIKEYPELWNWRSRDWPDYLDEWIKVERESYDIGIHFGIRTWDTMKINKFIIKALRPYQTNNNHQYIIFFKYDSVIKILDEITPEKWEFKEELNKYNL